MKQKQFLRYLTQQGCFLKREGRLHSLWINPKNGRVEAVPRHSELSDLLCRKICKYLEI